MTLNSSLRLLDFLFLRPHFFPHSTASIYKTWYHFQIYQPFLLKKMALRGVQNLGTKIGFPKAIKEQHTIFVAIFSDAVILTDYGKESYIQALKVGTLINSYVFHVMPSFLTSRRERFCLLLQLKFLLYQNQSKNGKHSSQYFILYY